MIEALSGVTATTPTERVLAPAAKPQAEAVEAQPQGIAPKAAEAVENALKALDPPIMGQNERLSISRDEKTGLFIYSSVDRETGKVVRQWPVESMLQFKAYIREISGVMVDRQV
ncbi:hypothetical protein sos41_12730 [Alphaproteobacteria bacterium SO-S41]|nr:hypothetical protein sos41_12730 [Alphaproteobacteria bacterium SO-S41]